MTDNVNQHILYIYIYYKVLNSICLFVCRINPLTDLPLTLIGKLSKTTEMFLAWDKSFKLRQTNVLVNELMRQ